MMLDISKGKGIKEGRVQEGSISSVHSKTGIAIEVVLQFIS